MIYHVKIPQLTETMEEATVAKWYKAPGDRVQKKENLYQVETDKSTMDVESVDAGFLCTILVAGRPDRDCGTGDRAHRRHKGRMLMSTLKIDVPQVLHFML